MSVVLLIVGWVVLSLLIGASWLLLGYLAHVDVWKPTVDRPRRPAKGKH